MRILWFAAPLGLLACTPAPASGDIGGDTAGEPAADLEFRSIHGTYVVNYVNEAEPMIGIAGHEPTVTIDAERIHFQSQCIYENWSYERDGENLETGPWDYGGDPIEMCARGVAAGEEAIIAAIDGADTVRLLADGIWMSGRGGNVQMGFEPDAEDRAARAVDLTGSWTVQALDGEDLSPGIAVEVSWFSIWWEPNCAGQGVSYMIEGDRFDAPQPGNPGMVCDIGFPSELPEIWTAMAEADSIERTANGSVLISGNGRSVLLAPAAGGGA
ncbi:hypothetical protein [Aurantiacibacter sediminis]|uniref:META domain-containing protein n=1 Tax=Aurantiacibacter sediminis TaxID=2793064 RepID=A0ABS0N114_9SPHN|nr:hypothetical protein [Aurantiacibacter sediminis]MBH5321652.1 hypothetical protein [Aurantiacibacter sediminis]